jgi:P27 family predicted phage terminase small subunit
MPKFKTSKKNSSSGGDNRGRKRLPTNLHVLNGNPSKIDIKERQENEPKFESSGISCPVWLDDYAKEEWNRLSPELQNLGLLTDADLAAFAAYCQSFSDWRHAVEILKEESLIQQTATGYKQQHPAVGIRNSAMEKMKAFLVEFGFTPASRSRVTFKEQEKPEGIGDLLSG